MTVAASRGPVLRKEVRGKVTGTADYVDDLKFPGMLHAITVRTTVPRGRIVDVTYQEGVPWHEFTIVTAADIPGKNVVSLIVDDQPYLSSGDVNHAYEPILLLAHPDRHILEKARSLVHFSYENLPPVFELEESLKAETVIWGRGNIIKSYLMEKGDVDSAWSQAAFIVEDEYATGAQEQMYIEPNGMVAVANPEDGVTVWGSMQCPYYVHKALVALFGLPSDKIRVIQQETGGAFGGKEEYPSMIAGHAALLAWKSGCPVKLIYDREEDMAATTKRHPSRTRHKTAVSADGKLLAMDIDFAIDGGAYATLSAVVLSRGTIHAAGPYKCDNVRVSSKAVATNTPPHGAFRGFGAPQSLFALERHMDKVARTVGLSPEELRRRNFLHTGDTTSTGQTIQQPLDLAGLQDRALEYADYHRKQQEFATSNRGSKIKRGVGFASFLHGAGFTGSGERYLQSVVELEATSEGIVRVLCSMTEMGQGTNTVLTEIVAKTMGIPYESVEILRPDTSLVPNSGPTVASRTSMIIGKLLQRAAVQLKEKLTSCEPTSYPVRVRTQYEEPPGIHWDDQKYQGDAYGAYSWATYVASVSVDTSTGELSVDDFVALQEVGHVLHPILAAGQIEGGVLQGIGFAIYEKVVWKQGAMANNRMTNYIIPTTSDTPPIRVFFEEIPYEHGALGAKGIGELPMDGPAPAIANAIENALGIPFNSVPVMAEDVLAALGSSRQMGKVA
jgi:CO/xanthine dehydrogenase Mo-binding subunit